MLEDSLADITIETLLLLIKLYDSKHISFDTFHDHAYRKIAFLEEIMDKVSNKSAVLDILNRCNLIIAENLYNSAI
jgi:hypothetical protein